MRITYLAFIALLLLSAISFAGCATDTFAAMCSGCLSNASADQQECTNQMGANVTICYAQQYPLMMVAKSRDNCSEFDSCVSQTGACIITNSIGSGGNMTRACQEGTLTTCFAQMDVCVASANEACRGRGQEAAAATARQAAGSVCPCLTGLVLAAFAGLLLCSNKDERGRGKD